MPKIVTWIVIGIIIIVGAWYFLQGSSTPAMPYQTGTPTSQTSGGASADTSDAQLQADLAASDMQIQAAGEASASAGSFNDTLVQQTE